MKKLIGLCLCACAAVAAVAQQKPVLCGHRGSAWGVENSVESFTKGAQMGYQYLETDFKVTKDKQLVCSHDDDLSRLGGSTMTIAGNNLADLQAVPFTQTRNGVQYTGRLCSAQEYLDVCKQYNVRPLIELKWATGINSNDCSNIPMLIDFIERNGFRNTCIILTSMKPCLEYIRKNYPDIELEFLTGEYWANHFDWCVEQKIDVDIQTGYFDKATVTKYHDAGLKVNCWTVNTDANYKTYGNMGCDYITTDSMDPTQLPDLDPSVTNPPNTVDYPNLQAEVHGTYEPEKVTETDLPAALAALKLRRAVMDNQNRWYVLGYDADDKAVVQIVNALDGSIAGAVNLEGINARIGDIARDAQGNLMCCTTGNVTADGSGDTFRVYRWTDPAQAAQEVLALGTTAVFGNFASAVVGEAMAVSGRANDLKIYVSSRPASGTTYSIAGLSVKNGLLDSAESACAMSDDYTTEAWGDFGFTVSPRSRNNIIVDSRTMHPAEYSFTWGTSGIPMEKVATTADGLVPAVATGMSFHRRGSKVYALVPACSAGGSGYTATLHDATEGIEGLTPVSATLHKGLGDKPHTFAATAFSTGAEGTYMHILAQGQGMASFKLIKDKEPVVVEDVDLELTCDWLYSVNNGTVTADIAAAIDGTNAQQGTAANGLFYINDRIKKQINVLDKNGLAGTIPGGAGYGCARDDAGNIIVRDDTGTGTGHSFIVYPAGARPEAYGTPVRLTVEVPLEGQTNFINAGGDILGGIGHIYMFPNKQNAVNIITVQNGKVAGTSKRTDLSYTGSTAAYVVPLGDDSENWMYQVRTTGIKKYSGGENVDISTTRPATTAPSRNSTGGFAFFTLRGNDILVHNSGSNYTGGFTVRNYTKDNAVVRSVDPIGNKGYAEGGNYSTFNWLIAEPAGPGAYTVYQYCPANGYGCYTLRDKNYDGVDDIVADPGTDVSVAVDGVMLRVIGTDVRNLEVYSTGGARLVSTQNAVANLASLPAGLYIARVNGITAVKFVKK